jgi:hypothetical protein
MRKKPRGVEYWGTGIVFGIPASIIIGATLLCPTEQRVCARWTTVVEITRNAYRTTYVKLSDGSTLGLYTPTVAPGDIMCAKWEQQRVEPRYRLW